jgi:hypothetical protein
MSDLSLSLPERLDGCKRCQNQPHVEHADQPATYPILVCDPCDRPTRHRFESVNGRNGGGIGRLGSQVFFDHLWRCTECSATRIWGCANDGADPR